MNTARLHKLPNRRPRAGNQGITVAQYREIMAAIRELPDRISGDWRSEVPASSLPSGPLIPADFDCIPF